VARVRVRVKVDRARARADSMQVAERLVLQTTRGTQNRAKVTSPVDTGLMRASHVVKVVRHFTRVVGTVRVLVPYAVPVHDGWSRTEPIFPVNKKALKFKIAGRTVIVKAVYSPAHARGRPWLYESLVEVATPRGFRVSRTHHL